MRKDQEMYQNYLTILREELIPAMGCTEPIALAYASARVCEILGTRPERIHAAVSGSIIKNVKGVYVPNTRHLKGIEAAVAAGAAVGQADRKLEVLSSVSSEDQDTIESFLKEVPICVEPLEQGHIFDMILTAYAGNSYARIRISDQHTHVVLLEKDRQILYREEESVSQKHFTDRSQLSLRGIWDFAMTADTEDVRELLDKQLSCNCAIADEGLRNEYGACIGRILMQQAPDDLKTRARARAAAGSDARMNGCELPVIINSGSGNQGITCSVPVAEYAGALSVSREMLYRALLLSNLTSVHIKHGIGTLSAYCGAVSAAASAGGAIAYLCGGDYEAYTQTVINTLVSASGIVCDGAKASCAAKISAALDTAFLSMEIHRAGKDFENGDGLVMDDPESTIRAIGTLGYQGMHETNQVILQLMTGD